MATRTHPLVSLNEAEVNTARDIVRKTHPGAVLQFRVTYLQEPPKAELTQFLEFEHSGRLGDIKADQWPRRIARVHYDVLEPGTKTPKSIEVLVDLDGGRIASTEDVRSSAQAAFTL